MGPKFSRLTAKQNERLDRIFKDETSRIRIRNLSISDPDLWWIIDKCDEIYEEGVKHGRTTVNDFKSFFENKQLSELRTINQTLSESLKAANEMVRKSNASASALAIDNASLRDHILKSEASLTDKPPVYTSSTKPIYN